MLRLVARRVPQKVQGIVRLFEVYVPSRIQKDRGFNEINYILIYTRVPIGIWVLNVQNLKSMFQVCMHTRSSSNPWRVFI